MCDYVGGDVSDIKIIILIILASIAWSLYQLLLLADDRVFEDDPFVAIVRWIVNR